MKRNLYQEMHDYVSQGGNPKEILPYWENENSLVQLVSKGYITFREHMDNLRKVPEITKPRAQWPKELEKEVAQLEECLGPLHIPYIAENVIVGGFIGSIIGLVFGRLKGPSLADKYMAKPEEFPSLEQYKMTRRSCLFKFTGISSFIMGASGMLCGGLCYLLQRSRDYAKADLLDELISPLTQLKRSNPEAYYNMQKEK